MNLPDSQSRFAYERLEGVVHRLTEGKYTVCPQAGAEASTALVAKKPVATFLGIPLPEPLAQWLYWHRAENVPLELDIRQYIATGHQELPITVHHPHYYTLSTLIQQEATMKRKP